MSKKKVPTTDEEKFQAALVSEKELARLERTYILLERDRKELTSASKMEKQRKVIEIFTREHNNILNNLMVATCSTKEKDDKKNMNRLNEMLIEYDYYSARVKAKKVHIKEVQSQIQSAKKKYVEVKSKLTTDRQHEERIRNAEVYLGTLENKLELQMRKFGAICWDNRKERDEIAHMLYERANFLKIWDKLIVKLNTGKKFTLDLIEQATIAYDQREEWCMKLQSLRIKAHQDMMGNVYRMREFKRQQDENKKLEDFLGKKSQKRMMLDLREKQRAKREDRLKKSSEMVQKHNKILDDICDFTGDEHMTHIVQTYARQEQENFMMFKFIDDTLGELETTSEKLAVLHTIIDEKRVLHNHRSVQQTDTLEGIEDELMQAQEARENSEKEIKRADRNLEEMFAGIGNMCRVVHCNTDPILQLLGDNNRIQMFNVLLYLEMLEKRVHALIPKVHHKERLLVDKKKMPNEDRVYKEQLMTPSLYLIEEIAETNPCPLCIEHDVVGAEVIIELLQRPLNQQEIEVKLKRRLEYADAWTRIHNVSNCHLPKSRAIIQRRYQ